MDSVQTLDSDLTLVANLNHVIEALPRRRLPEALKQLAQSNVVGLTFNTFDGKIVDANDEFLRMVGYSREELEAGELRWTDLTPPEWLETNREQIAHIQATGSAPAFEKEYFRKDGSRVPVLIGLAAISTGNYDAASIVIDLTERKRMEADRDRLVRERMAMLDSVGEGIYGLDDRGQCTFINQAALRMFGYEAEECLGRNMHDLVHYKTADGSPMPLAECAIFLAARTGGSVRLDNETVWRKDGTSFLADYSSSPILVNGRIEGSVVTFRDVSECKKAQDSLRASEERFRSAFSNAAAGMFIVDLEGNFLEVNRAFCEMTGYSEAELLESSFQVITHPADLEDNLRQFGRLLRQETPGFVAIKRYQRKGGGLLWVRCSVSVLRDAAGNPAQIVSITESISDRMRAEADLRRSEESHRRIVENTHEGICTCDGRRGITYCNPRLVQMLGYPEGTTLSCDQIHFEEDSEETDRRFERRKRGICEAYDARLKRQDGSPIWVSTSSSPIHDDRGNFAGSLCMFTDVTDRKRLEDQLRQSQKMEAVGRLAGGIAHDFNNLLTVILGYSGVLERKLAAGDPLGQNVTEIRKAGERAAALTQKLLAFSRKQVMRPRVLSVNELIREMEAMLRRLIGEDIDLVTILDPAVSNIKADPGQMEQVLMNLAVNSRDAMGQGGHLLIETKREELDEKHAELRSLRAGAYVVLTVTDTGCGMDEQTKARIFEPFFTTKEPGSGTGLGLSTVLGIVNQSGGSITVYSEVDVGTTFRIYLPLVGEPVTCEVKPKGFHAEPGGESILIVEDDAGIRALTASLLREQGYQVMEAANAEEAVVASEQLSTIDLLLTDVVMPGMNGHELAALLVASRPSLRVVYMSGYTENGTLQQGLLEPGLNFLSKPFRPEELVGKVGEVLAGRKGPKRILIADDDPQVRSFLASLLDIEGYTVVQASNGKEAAARCVDMLPDLVITDLIMPEQEGLETIHIIRRNWPKVRVIAVSGAYAGAYLDLAKKLGADAVLRKPFDPDTILSEVRRLTAE